MQLSGRNQLPVHQAVGRPPRPGADRHDLYWDPGSKETDSEEPDVQVLAWAT